MKQKICFHNNKKSCKQVREEVLIYSKWNISKYLEINKERPNIKNQPLGSNEKGNIIHDDLPKGHSIADRIKIHQKYLQMYIFK